MRPIDRYPKLAMALTIQIQPYTAHTRKGCPLFRRHETEDPTMVAPRRRIDSSLQMNYLTTSGPIALARDATDIDMPCRESKYKVMSLPYGAPSCSICLGVSSHFVLVIGSLGTQKHHASQSIEGHRANLASHILSFKPPCKPVIQLGSRPSGNTVHYRSKRLCNDPGRGTNRYEPLGRISDSPARGQTVHRSWSKTARQKCTW
jgi:hypothetical protein